MPGGLRRALRRPLRRALAQLLDAERVLRDVVVVLQVLGEQHVHHAERERRVRARPDRDPLVALSRGARADRIDADDRRALLARLQHERPEVRVRRERVRAPEEDEVASQADRLPCRRRCSRRPSSASPHRRPSSRSCDRASTRRVCGRSVGPSTRPAGTPSCPRTSTAGSPRRRVHAMT